MQITDKHKTIGVGADCSDTGVSGRKLLGWSNDIDCIIERQTEDVKK